MRRGRPARWSIPGRRARCCPTASSSGSSASWRTTYQGAVNAGRPLLLEGGLDWKAMSLSPKDMDFLEAKHTAAREIALAFGVPPMLLGIPGDNTYSNYQEANRVFWRSTVLPLASRIGAALTQWLAPAFGDGIRLVVDTDQIEALANDRAALWEQVSKAPFLTVNEKREAIGYGRSPVAKAGERPSAAIAPCSRRLPHPRRLTERGLRSRLAAERCGDVSD